MFNEGEAKTSMKIGCLLSAFVIIAVPFITLISLYEQYLGGINPKDYLTTKKGLTGVLMLLIITIGLIFWFKIFKETKSLLVRFLLSFLMFVIEIFTFLTIVSFISVKLKSNAILLLLATLFVSFKIYYIFFKKINFSRFTDFIELFRKVDKTKLETFRLRTKSKRIKIKNPFSGIYIQGGAGSGKSESLMKPMIKQSIEQNFSYILYDFKGDLSKFEKEILELNSIYDSYTLNFKDPYSSQRFNPINPEFLTGPASIYELAKTLFYNLTPGAIKQSNNYFLDEAINFFTSVVIYLKNKHKELCTIPHVISILSQIPIEKIIPLISRDIEALPFISSLKNVLELGASKQIAGVTGTLQGNLAKFSSKELFWILSGNDFTPDINNPEDIKRLTIINDSVLPGFYGPLVAIIINVCLKNMNRPGMQKSAIFLDEAPTIYIPEFEQIPATARSNKIATIYACQDYMQIVDKYGREKAQTIISNLSSQFFGRTTNVESIRLISDLFGKYDKTFETKSRGTSTEIFDIDDFKTNKNVSESIQERYRVTSNELTNLNPGEFYTITGKLKEKKSV